jgi:hypothetical protein
MQLDCMVASNQWANGSEILKRLVDTHGPIAGVLLLGAALLTAAGCQPSKPPASDHVTLAAEPDIPEEGNTSSDGAIQPDQRQATDEPQQRLDPNDPRARPRIGAAENSPEMPARPRLPQRPIRPGMVNDITFDDLELKMPLDSMFDREMLTDRVEQLDNQQVRIRGFIFAGGVFRQTGITSFPLVMNTQCKFGPGGYAYCVILVDLEEGESTNFTTRPVTVEGTLSVRPYNSGGFTWSVYHIQGTKVM